MSKAQKLTGNLSQRKGRENLSSITCHLSLKKRGSALLIVLGMFAFMLVSAVAFSVYMRASRAPSSYVRRNASTRQVVKAAVARAIDELDTAIGNDPFPGVGYNHDAGSDGINQSNRYKNDNWHGRVFTPSNEVALAETVSTLTLEGLGYLPPCLVNEVRYWSRHTRTAKWHSFNYGLGRYAFTAVNVSDFFDLNMFAPDPAGNRRPYLNRSSAPHGRISPTHLFRGGLNGDMDTGKSAASAFLNVLASGSGIGGGSYPSLSDVPFLSMMDFNLAVAGLGNLGGLVSPYINLIRDNNNATFLTGSMEEAARRTVFMAGGWNGDSNLTYQAYSAAYGGSRINLRYPEFQPFAGYSWFPDKGKTTLSHCYNDVSESHPFWKPYNNNFPVIATAMLCDYLDFDSVPLSLCIPCVEAVPMICGVEIDDTRVKCETEYKQGPASTPATPPGAPATRTDECNLKIAVEFSPIITVVYPFVNERPNLLDYEIECYARIFFQEEQSSADSAINDSGLRDELFNLGTLDSKWSSLNASGTGASFFEAKGSVSLSAGDLRNAVRKISGATGVAREQAALISKKVPMVTIPSTTKKLADLQLQQPSGGAWSLVSVTDPGDINFYPAGAMGGASRVNFQTTFATGATAPKFRPMVALWVRIKDSEGKTVDMSPTIPAYDSVNNQAANTGINGFNLASGGQAGAPAFRFYPLKSSPGIVPDTRSGGPYDWQAGSSAPVTENPDWKQKSYIANDPRINWAPEQWWVTDQTADPGQLWLNHVQTFRGGDTSRDSDIFMSVSDQGYLQSMYEWMMIPQVREINGAGDLEWGAFAGGGGYNGQMRTAIGDVLHANVMWRTYRSDAFGHSDNWGSIDDLAFDEAENGLRVNPYSNCKEIMLAAFANMPQDWWAASTNHLADGKSYMAPGSTTFEDGYLFDWSCNYQDVYNMAHFWYGAFRRWDLAKEERGKHLYMADAWKDVFEDAVDWRLGNLRYNVSVAQTDLDPAGLQDGTVASILKDLTLAERKFLYGYLKGCYANTSQLFLVFVRAETTAGGAVGAGARAVALVWRDPKPPVDGTGKFVKAAGGNDDPQYGRDNANVYLQPNPANGSEESWRLRARTYPPHRTRILFYHQLD